MAPLIDSGNYVLVKQIKADAYRTGDVVITNHPEMGTLIKILGKRGKTGFKLHGYNIASAPAVDMGIAAPESLTGKVILQIAPHRINKVKRVTLNKPFKR